MKEGIGTLIASLVILGIVLLMARGCNGTRNIFKHVESATIGIERTVTLYDGFGEPIRSWSTNSQIEDKGGTVYFLDNKGKATTVSGTFIIEEK